MNGEWPKRLWPKCARCMKPVERLTDFGFEVRKEADGLYRGVHRFMAECHGEKEFSFLDRLEAVFLIENVRGGWAFRNSGKLNYVGKIGLNSSEEK